MKENEAFCAANPTSPKCAGPAASPPQTGPSDEQIQENEAFCAANPDSPKCGGTAEAPPPATEKICEANPKYPGCDTLAQPNLGRPEEDGQIGSICEQNPLLPQCQASQETAQPEVPGGRPEEGEAEEAAERPEEGAPDEAVRPPSPRPENGTPRPTLPPPIAVEEGAPPPPPQTGDLPGTGPGIDSPAAPPSIQSEGETCPEGQVYSDTYQQCMCESTDALPVNGTCIPATEMGYDEFVDFCMESMVPAMEANPDFDIEAGSPEEACQTNIVEFFCSSIDAGTNPTFSGSAEDYAVCRDRTCPENAVNTDGVCACQAGFFQQPLESGSMQCVAECTGQFVAHGDSCVYYCPDGLWKSYETGACVAACPQGTSQQTTGQGDYVNRRCLETCQPGFSSHDGVCMDSCPEGTALTSERRCVAESECPPDRYLVMGACRFAPCPSGYEAGPDGACLAECPAGETRGADGQCTNPCPAGEAFVNQQCRASCTEGVMSRTGECVEACTGNSFLRDGYCVNVNQMQPEEAIEACLAGDSPVFFNVSGTDRASCEAALAEECQQRIEDSVLTPPAYCVEPGQPDVVWTPPVAGEPPAEDEPPVAEGPQPDEGEPPVADAPPSEDGPPAGDEQEVAEDECPDGQLAVGGACLPPTEVGYDQAIESCLEGGSPGWPAMDEDSCAALVAEVCSDIEGGSASGLSGSAGDYPFCAELPPDGDQPPVAGELPHDDESPVAGGTPDEASEPPYAGLPPIFVFPPRPPIAGSPPGTGHPPPSAGLPPGVDPAPPAAGAPPADAPPPQAGLPPLPQPAPGRPGAEPPIKAATLTDTGSEGAAQLAGSEPLAVVIANGAYQHEDIPRRADAIANATEFVRFLKEDVGLAAEQIVPLADGRLRDFEALFGTADIPGGLQLTLAAAGTSDLIIYFSGHAAAIDSGRDAVLLSADADPDDVAATGYRLSTLYGNLAAMGVERLRVFIDAAFADRLDAQPERAAGRPKPVVTYPVIGPFGIQTPAQWVVMTAGTGAEPTYQDPDAPRSAFTDALIAGLSGEADTNGDGDAAVTAGELADFVRDTVGRMVEEATGGSQTPALFGEDNEILRLATERRRLGTR